MAKKIIKVSVRDLVEFILRSGDLNNEFVGRKSDRALEGARIHRKIQKSQDESYLKEVTIKQEIEYDYFTIIVEGRADGIITDNNGVTIDEIKTIEKPLAEIDEDYNPLHMAQAKCYAYIYGMQNKLDIINVRLTYYQIDTGDIKFINKTYNIEELKQFFDDLVGKYYVWAKLSYDWEIKRNKSIKITEFPYESYRKGQRKLAVFVYRTIENKKKLFVNAPTGTGKTISTIFPSIKSMGEGLASKIFYLTAKTITRNVAYDTFGFMKSKNLKLKVLEITAKDKICFKEKPNCNPETCEYAEGHFDRINDAIMDILTHTDEYNKENIEKYAQKHKVCPFEFSLDIAIWSDAIICDYNYVFDPNVSLKRFFQDKNDYILLIDEAHNLVDRSREMFSAELFKKQFMKIKMLLRNKNQKITRNLTKINSYFLELKKLCSNDEYYISDDRFDKLDNMLIKLVSQIEEYLLKYGKTKEYDDLLEIYFNVLKYLKISDMYDTSYKAYVEKLDDDVKIKLYCIDPSKQLDLIMQKVRSVVLFSATLLPIKYYRALLGGDDEDYIVSIDSPFKTKNRLVLIASDVSTKFKDRKKSYNSIVLYIDSLVKKKPGNYIVFFPSYEYMKKVYDKYKKKHDGDNIYIQEPGMSENERDEFLDLFREDKNTVGFCVLGGVFSESIDLKSNRLIGVIIVGVGLPQICLERNLIKAYFDQKYKHGYEFAYMYPGFNKVMQAAGRVIRTETDKGVILIIDERFSHKNYIKLFPREWTPNVMINIHNMGKYIEDFWTKS